MRRYISLLIILAMMVTSMNLTSMQVYAEETTQDQAIDLSENEKIPEKSEEDETGAGDIADSHDEDKGIDNEVTKEDESNGDVVPENDSVFQEENTGKTIEDNDDPEIEDRANSWRYINGVPISEGSGGRVRSNAFHPSATRKGIDVSKWQGRIDWEQVKASGVEFAIIRCGYGSDYTSQDDEYWVRNVTECERLGIPYGVYLYSYATNTADALSEARHVLRLINGHNLSYPVYFDMEDESTIGSDFGAIAEVFCNTIQSAGYAAGVYANLNWWNNYLTDARFSKWHKWVAQYNTTCKYEGEYSIWQYSSSGSVPGISGEVDMNYLINYPKDHGVSMAVDIPTDLKDVISCSAYVAKNGWMQGIKNGCVAGTVGLNRKLEALKINMQNLDKVNVEYSVYIDGEWKKHVSDDTIMGMVDQNKAIEAIKIRLVGENAEKYNVYYRTHVSNIGWMGWTSNDNPAGSKGYGYSVEAYQIAVLPANENAPGATDNAYREKMTRVQYEAHVQDIGWQGAVENDAIAGTVGQNKKIEALKIKLYEQEFKGDVEYSVYVEGEGWQSYVSNGKISGTVGKNKKVEAVSIRLKGDIAEQYNIYYRVHSSDIGWQGWAKDGDKAGTEFLKKKVEALQIQLVKKGGEAPGSTDNAFVKGKSTGVAYVAHVQDIGWQNYVSNGQIAGTVGKNKQVEALKIQLIDPDYDGSVKYRAHVEDIGWQEYVEANKVSGTEGKNKQIEAIEIQLTGEMKNQYDIYYRVHSSDFGWLGWAKNGEKAGSQGYAKQVEAVEVKLVEKGGKAPGTTNQPFMKKSTEISYSAHVQDIGWQRYVSNGQTAGTEGRNKQMEALKIQLQNQDCEGSVQYKAHVEDIGWQKYVSANRVSGTEGKNKQIEAIAIELTGEMKEQYDVYYRVHSSDFGWLGWAKNGEEAGSQGYAKQMEAVQIKLVKKGDKAPGSTENAFVKK